MLRLYNTLTRKVEAFKSLKKGQVSMYSCGPTVYDYAHIGNFRAYMVADLLKRYLRYTGLRVKHVMNLTDVDDKTIKESGEKGVSLSVYTKKYSKAFFEDLEHLNIDKADVFPRATDHIKEIVALVKRLKKNKLAYEGEDKSWYFDISKLKDYGKLSRLKLDELEATERVKKDQYAKEQAQDFALWKAYDTEDGDVAWETDLGKGRPGWHIECSAMSMKHLGETFDIHTGGVDLIFPHHENERAQSVGSTKRPFVRWWVHNEHLLVEGRKMSKSMGNFYTLRDLLDKAYEPIAIRYLLLSVHYRQQMNFTMESLESARQSAQTINNFVFEMGNIKGGKDNNKVKKIIIEADGAFSAKMDDDLNVSEGLAVVFHFMRSINREEFSKNDADLVIQQMQKFDMILGILCPDDNDISKDIKKYIADREKAREAKNWKKADSIRASLLKKGIEVRDTANGPVWKKF